MQTMKRQLSIVLLVMACLLSTITPAQSVEKGQIDLTKNSFLLNSPVSLSGTWEFYPDKLLGPQDFDTNQNPEWITVPGSWHRQGDYPLLGVATYRLRILLSDQRGLTVYFPIINSAARIWVNGELTKAVGVVSKNRTEYKPKLSAVFVSLPDHTRQIEIIMQVANFSYFSSGIVSNPLLDVSSVLFTRMNRQNGIENFFAGSLIAMFIYQIILFMLFPKGKPYLWLALICLGVALRALIVHGGSFLLPSLFPSVSWELWKKLEFGSVYAITAFFPLYIYHLFQSIAPRWPVRVFSGVAVALCAAVVATFQYRYGQLLEVAHIMLLLGFIYAMYVTVKAWQAKISDAKVIFYAVLASFPFILTEIMKNSVYFPVHVPFMYLVELGVLVYLLFQVYLLASHYARSYRNLEELNLNLEQKVEERSGQLISANEVKNKLLSVMSHDIRSPLNSLKGILHIYNSGSIEKEEFDKYARQIENDLGNTTLLVDNVLTWTSSQLKGIQVHEEEVNLKEIVESNVDLFRTQAEQKDIHFHLDLVDPLVIRCDRNILNLVLRNLIANAVKFSHRGGGIFLSTYANNENYYLQVKDEGVGIESSILHALNNPRQVVSKQGTSNEKGTGLGLVLCRDYLDMISGRLTITSEPGKGSSFTVVLPCAS